ncbi:MAG TPA: PAS domain S-box protein [Syntrophales bacterium]|nr:PAS domain S-box protein [Syntrophales bacterium]
MKYRYQFLLLSLFALVCGFLFHSVNEGARKNAVDELISCKKLHALQAKRCMEGQFATWINVLRSVSMDRDIVDLNDDGKREMESLFKTNREAIRGITRIDGTGRILFAAPRDSAVLFGDISRQRHFLEMTETGEATAGGVLRTGRGFDVIAVHAPIRRDGVCHGSLAVLLDFQSVAGRYLEDIRIGEAGSIWMIDRDGTRLYCPVPGHVGRSAFENSGEFSAILAKARGMMEGKEGVASYRYEGDGGQEVEPVTRYAVYMPVTVGNSFWPLVVTSSEEEVMDSLQGFRNRLILLFAILLAGFVAFFAFGMRAWRIVRAEEKRGKAEEALRDSRQQLFDIIDFLPDATLVIDREGRVMAWNRAIERMTGVRSEEVIGKGNYEYSIPFYGVRRPILIDAALCPDDVAEGMYTLFRRQGDVLFGESYVQPHPQEETLYLSATASVLRDSQGNVVGAIECIRDETERKKAAETLRESEELYTKLVATLPDVVLRTDLGGKILFVNDIAFQTSGSDREEFEGGNIFEFIDPEARHEAVENAALMLQRPLGPREYPVVMRDGRRLLFEVNGDILRDDRGSPYGRVYVCRDVTERKKAEEALLESRNRLADIIDFLPEATLAVDREGKVIFWNRAIEEMTGCPASSMVGRGDYGYALPFYGERRPILIDFVLSRNGDVEKDYGFIEREGETLYTEKAVPRVRGQSRILWGKANPLYDTRGNLVGAIESIRDMTERRNMEEELRAAEVKYRSIFENAIEGICQSTMDGRLVTVNAALARMTGYDSPEDMIASVENLGKNLYIREEDRLNFIEIMAREGMVSGFEVEMKRKDGKTIWVIENSHLVRDREGNILYLEGTVEDVTMRKRLESQLLQAQKMEAIGTLAGGIAHDFNNLLMGILGHASLMSMQMEASNPHGERVKGIEDLVRSGANLTRQLLGFARGGRYEMKTIDLNEVLEKTTAMFMRTKKEISVHWKFGEGLWSVEADRGQIEQVLMNLFVNAWQAMPAGGDLYLTTMNVMLDEEKVRPYALAPGRYVKVSVTDTGVGMDGKTMERIFDPFFTTKEMGRGTGLGLSIVYGIIRGHRGIVEVSSEKGQGTTFEFHIPASEKPVLRQTGAGTEMPRGTETVLVVDDEASVARITKELLELLGYSVVTAESGAEAVECCQAPGEGVRLVILDMIMPGMSGEETFEQLKEIRPDLPVVLSSGYSLDGQAARIMEKGCRSFLQKPFLIKDLARTVRAALDG